MSIKKALEIRRVGPQGKKEAASSFLVSICFILQELAVEVKMGATSLGAASPPMLSSSKGRTYYCLLVALIA